MKSQLFRKRHIKREKEKNSNNETERNLRFQKGAGTGDVVDWPSREVDVGLDGCGVKGRGFLMLFMFIEETPRSRRKRQELYSILTREACLGQGACTGDAANWPRREVDVGLDRCGVAHVFCRFREGYFSEKNEKTLLFNKFSQTESIAN